MTDSTDNIDAAIEAFLKSAGNPNLRMYMPFAQEEMRKAMSTIMADAYSLGFDVAMKTNTLADTARLDWLADPEQYAAKVHMPARYIALHPNSLRSQIDAAMED